MHLVCYLSHFFKNQKMTVLGHAKLNLEMLKRTDSY
uniref:Uncharacterized protein n=1 Tax=Rhizophora mucronata TaxID=61149 RepID=A0A2P2J155_RHIMU